MVASSHRLRADIEESARPMTGIVHLGLGAFFRAHGAVYTADAMALAGGDWGIVGASLRSRAQMERLAPQGFAYTLATMKPDGPAYRTLEVLNDVLYAPDDPDALISLMAAPTTRIVSLTITEKGYCYDAATQQLDLTNADVIADIASPEAPLTAPGYMVAALKRRHDLGLPPFTVLSCDNLSENGDVARRVVLDHAGENDPDLAAWIAEHGRFPCTMVDRIVPAATSDDIASVETATCAYDAAPVMAEPFSQWVVEDDFVDGARPAWDEVGALLVDDVRPFESMKLRCLNGTHTAMAYLGYLAGFETVSACAASALFGGFLKHLWANEIIATIDAPPGVDLGAYTEALRERYANPAIKHRLSQIAMDGSQKLPPRILAPMADNLTAGRPIEGQALVVAGWMRFVLGVDERGHAIDVRDPMADVFKDIAARREDDVQTVDAFLALNAVFPPDLAGNAKFREAVTTAFSNLKNKGAAASVAAVVS